MTMKKIFALALGLTVIFSLSSCKDKDFDEKFADPSKTSTVTCDKLFSGAMYVGSATYKGFAYLTYWRMYTWEGTIAQFTQQRGFTNESGSVYYLSDSWATDRWNNFYEVLAQFRLMQATYNKESDTDKANDRIFLDLTEVFVYDHLAQLVDVFGPVPFTEAGYLGITGNYATSFPSYDSDDMESSMTSHARYEFHEWQHTLEELEKARRALDSLESRKNSMSSEDYEKERRYLQARVTDWERMSGDQYNRYKQADS